MKERAIVHLMEKVRDSETKRWREGGLERALYSKRDRHREETEKR